MYVSLSKQSLEMCMQFRTERFKTQYTAAEAFNPRDFQIDKLKRKKLPSKKEKRFSAKERTSAHLLQDTDNILVHDLVSHMLDKPMTPCSQMPSLHNILHELPLDN
jgi:hypothetical protein